LIKTKFFILSIFFLFIGDVLKEYRIKKGLSQGELANLLGISPSYLSLIEQGKRRFRFNMIMEIKERNKKIYDELFTMIKKEVFSKKLTGVSSWEIDEIIKILEKDSGLKVLRSSLSPSFRTRYNRAISIKGKVYPEMERFVSQYPPILLIFMKQIKGRQQSLWQYSSGRCSIWVKAL